MMKRRSLKIAGATLAEVLVSTAVTSILAAGMLVGMVTIQRSFRAAQHYARSQIEQARLIDYIARDLRRAITVTVDTYAGAERLNLTLPDFYGADGEPRDPVISRGNVYYGDPAAPVQVRYFKAGSSVIRLVGDNQTTLATDVDDFVLDYTDSGSQIVGVSVSFVPRYQLNARDVSTLRVGTATYATTLLRNKRAN